MYVWERNDGAASARFVTMEGHALEFRIERLDTTDGGYTSASIDDLES